MEKGCPSCGRMVGVSEQKCPYCNYDFRDLTNIINKYEEQRLKLVEVPKYAGFIKRVVATSIDIIIWVFIFTCISLIYIGYTNPENFLNTIYSLQTEINIEKFNTIYIIWILMPVCYLLYCIFRQYSKKFATIGERLVGIEVVDKNDESITFKAAFSRNIARILNLITLGLGFLIIIFTKKKQALSDMVSKTYVTNRITNEDYSKFRYTNPALRLLAYIIDIAYLNLLVWIYSFLRTSPFIPESIIKNFIVIMLGIILVVYVITYFPYMESKYGATFGKRLFDIKVVDLNGEKISFIKSIERLIVMVFEAIIPLSHILAFTMPRRQTLKDIITKTIVVNRH